MKFLMIKRYEKLKNQMSLQLILIPGYANNCLMISMRLLVAASIKDVLLN